jgi:hypothetical protein
MNYWVVVGGSMSCSGGFFMVLEAVGSLWNCWVVDDHVWDCMAKPFVITHFWVIL